MSLAAWIMRSRVGPPGTGLGGVLVLVLLDLAEVGRVEELLETDHLGALVGGILGELDVLLDHRFLVAGPFALDQGGFHDVGHETPNSLCRTTNLLLNSEGGPGWARLPVTVKRKSPSGYSPPGLRVMSLRV